MLKVRIYINLMGYSPFEKVINVFYTNECSYRII